MQALLEQARLLAPPPPSVWSTVSSLSLAQLQQLERLLASSPHNRQCCVGGSNTVNVLLGLLPSFGRDDADRRAALRRIIRHLGQHRFTVHNTRFVLAAVMRFLATSAATAEAAAAPSTTASASSAEALELLELLGEILTFTAGPAEMPAFWDMGAGVMGA